MDSFAEVVRVLNTAAFGTLALLALRQWQRPDRAPNRAALWLLLLLGDLAVLSAIGVFFHPKEVTGTVGVWVIKVILIVLFSAPWFLYRFMAVFDPPSRRTEYLVDTLAVMVVLATIALPRIPRSNDHPAWLWLYGWLVVITWSVQSLIVATRLWRAGADQPAVSRRRMRMLSVGSAVLTVAALPGTVPATSQPDAVKVVAQLLPLVAALAFYLAFTPPSWLRVVWRWPDQPLVRRAELNLMVGSSPREVTQQLLSRVTELLGGRGAFLSTAPPNRPEGPPVIAVHGMTVAEAQEALATIHDDGRRAAAIFAGPELLAMPIGAGWLGVRSSPYAPYFGRDELSLLQGLGTFAELVLQRIELFESEQRARLDLERANAELGTLVYGVSHDLKSPLITVLGYLDYLRNDYAGVLGEEGRHYLGRMEASALYMQDLIADLLELSRIGRVDVETQPVDLGALVDELVAELRVSHPPASLLVGPLPLIRANPARARQLFANLLENALRHGGRDDLTVRVWGRPTADGGADLVIADDGVGIPREYRERVFGIFERLEPRQGDRGGTGIGLAICRKIVEQLGGRIAVGDAPRGTEIVVSLSASAVITGVEGWTKLLEPQA
jgi:signal transduction histidine kinase